MFGNWLKWKSPRPWWHGSGKVTHMDNGDKARQTVDLICKQKAHIAALTMLNTALEDEIRKLKAQNDNH